MSVDIVIPALGESITEGTILRWLKNAGDAVERDEIVVEIETDKATMEVAAPETGTLSEILKPAGEKVEIGEVIGLRLHQRRRKLRHLSRRCNRKWRRRR